MMRERGDRLEEELDVRSTTPLTIELNGSYVTIHFKGCIYIDSNFMRYLDILQMHIEH